MNIELKSQEVLDLLDKYNNQQDLKIRSLERAIKKMLNGEELGTGLINTLFGYGLISSEIPSNNQPDYKSAWDELKEGFKNHTEGWLNHEDQSYMYSKFEILEKKYNLDNKQVIDLDYVEKIIEGSD